MDETSTTTHTQKLAAGVLSPDEVAAINQTRAILNAIADTLRSRHTQTFEYGMLRQAADAAEEALFGTLNIAANYLGCQTSKQAIEDYYKRVV